MGIHIIATVLVVGLGLWQGLSATRWALLLLAIGGVWISEAFNTALERLCNVVSPEYHPLIKQVKDIAAAAVLMASFVAVGIGMLVFAC